MVEMIAQSVLDITMPDVFLCLPSFCHIENMFIKIESMNPAGSIKFKTALSMIGDLERRGILGARRTRVIESSSGNLGIALSVICKVRGYHFTCITDPNATVEAIDLMRAYGAEVIVVSGEKQEYGHLGCRIEYIANRISVDKDLVWPNQYANHANTLAHYRTTAREIDLNFAHLDFLFIGAGTTGTLTGCAKYFAWHRPEVRIIAVDSVGSVTFGGSPGIRHIPGLGTSRRPELASLDNVSELVYVSEEHAVDMCNQVRDRYGVLVGGSTGSVLAGVAGYATKIDHSATVVAICPDLGDRYSSTVYSQDWLARRGIKCAESADSRPPIASAAALAPKQRPPPSGEDDQMIIGRYSQYGDNRRTSLCQNYPPQSSWRSSSRKIP
jgi:N-(2-amino-2-carboxyethyl)-L-glutamate synthase